MKIWWVRMLISNETCPHSGNFKINLSKFLRRNPGTDTAKFELVESFRHHRSRCGYSGSMVCQWHHAPWWWHGGITMNSLKVGEWLTGEDVEIPWHSSWKWKWELASCFVSPTKSPICPDVSVTSENMYMFYTWKIDPDLLTTHNHVFVPTTTCTCETSILGWQFPPFLTNRGGRFRDLVESSKVVAVATGSGCAQCGRIDWRPTGSSWWLWIAWHLPANASEIGHSRCGFLFKVGWR